MRLKDDLRLIAGYRAAAGECWVHTY